MLELAGKYNSASIKTDKLEDTAEEQIFNLLNQYWAKDNQIVIMPDVHAGADCVIGLTMKLDGKHIPPSLVGSDIGCGVTLVRTEFEIDDNLETSKYLDDVIREKIPYGINNHARSPLADKTFEILKNNLFFKLDRKNLTNGFGTLGGGNHFIEAYNEDGKLALGIHSGSRKLGSIVYKHYMDMAKKSVKDAYIEYKQRVIEEYKKAGRQKELEKDLKELDKVYHRLFGEVKIYTLTGDNYDDYINDVEVITRYASQSRIEMARRILSEFNININDCQIIDKPHNYVEKSAEYVGNDKDGEMIFNRVDILRKGSQAAYLGDYVLIPINMKDGVILGQVKGNNPEVVKSWNYSAPHGAGRVLSRSKAKKELLMSDFEEQMKDVYSTTVSSETLDEAPDAYKTLDNILDKVKDLIVVHKVLKPIYNFKGGKDH
jgi:RNA-splicing ligase RtcB